MSDREKRGDFKKARRGQAPASDPDKLNRRPPHSVEAEQGVLGCALLGPAATLPQCIAVVRP